MPLWYVNPGRKKHRSKSRRRSGAGLHGAALRAFNKARGIKSGKGRRRKRRNPAGYTIGTMQAARAHNRRAGRSAARAGARSALGMYASAKKPGKRRKARRAGLARRYMKQSRATVAVPKRRRKRRTIAQIRAAARRAYSHPVYGPVKRRRKRKGAGTMAKKRKHKKKGRTRRKNPARHVRRRRKRRNPARVHARRRRKRRSHARKNPARRRRRSHRRKSHARRNPSRRRRSRSRRRMRRNPSRRRRAVPALRRARKAIRRARKRRSGSAYNYVRRHRMRSNPGSRGGGMVGVFTGVVKQALPIAIGLYGTRFLVNTFGYRLPMVDKLGSFAKPVVAGIAVMGMHLATRKGPLAKYRSGAMLGSALNFIDTLVGAFAPANVKAMFGLADDGVYDRAMLGDYVQVGDYITTGDYIEVGGLGAEQDLGVEQELGALEQELGALEQELGASDSLSRPLLGGVSQSSMLAPVGARQMIAAVPERSFVSDVPGVGAGFDNGNKLYQGIFAGGFGS
jgi:hypothetical protein